MEQSHSLWRTAVAQPWIQALFGIFLSWIWTMDSAKDRSAGKVRVSISWFAVGIAILVTFMTVFVQQKEWGALAIATAGLVFQGWRAWSIFGERKQA